MYFDAIILFSNKQLIMAQINCALNTLRYLKNCKNIRVCD